MTPYKCYAKELRLGDVVRTAGPPEPYIDCTVKQIRATGVLLFRPFVHTSDFTYTGGVICYVGIEEFEIYPESTVTVIKETEVKGEARESIFTKQAQGRGER